MPYLLSGQGGSRCAGTKDVLGVSARALAASMGQALMYFISCGVGRVPGLVVGLVFAQGCCSAWASY